MRSILLLCLWGLAGCGSGGKDPQDSGLGADLGPTCDRQGPTRYLAVRTLVFGRADKGVSPGFDLDGEVTADGGATGCGVEDYVSPDGTSGVDNAMAGLLPFLESTEAAALEPLIQQKINEGEVLLILEIGGLDDAENDDCVEVGFLRGTGIPQLGSDGLLLADQTYELDPTVGEPVRARGAIEDGVLEVRDLGFLLPIVVFDFDIVLDLNQVALQVAFDEDGGAEMLLGAGFEWGPLLDELLTTPIDQVLVDALPLLFGSLADMNPDASGVCQDLSVVMEMSAAGAFVFED